MERGIDLELLEGVEESDVAKVQSALAEGANPNVRKKVTLLCDLKTGQRSAGKVRVQKRLLLPDVYQETFEDVVDTQMETIPAESALALAILRGRPNIVRAILAAGGDPNVPITWQISEYTSAWIHETWSKAPWSRQYHIQSPLLLAIGRGGHVTDLREGYTHLFNHTGDGEVLRVSKPGPRVLLRNPKTWEDAYDECVVQPRPDIVQLLLGYGARVTAEVVNAAKQSGDRNILAILDAKVPPGAGLAPPRPDDARLPEAVLSPGASTDSGITDGAASTEPSSLDISSLQAQGQRIVGRSATMTDFATALPPGGAKPPPRRNLSQRPHARVAFGGAGPGGGAGIGNATVHEPMNNPAGTNHLDDPLLSPPYPIISQISQSVGPGADREGWQVEPSLPRVPGEQRKGQGRGSLLNRRVIEQPPQQQPESPPQQSLDSQEPPQPRVRPGEHQRGHSGSAYPGEHHRNLSGSAAAGAGAHKRIPSSSTSSNSPPSDPIDPLDSSSASTSASQITKLRMRNDQLVVRLQALDHQNTELQYKVAQLKARVEELEVEREGLREQLDVAAAAAASAGVGALAPGAAPGAGAGAGAGGNPFRLSRLMEPGAPKLVRKLMTVVKDFEPREADELALKAGQEVFCHFEFRDGWGSGLNADTGLMGVFPMNRLGPTVTAATAKKNQDPIVEEVDVSPAPDPAAAPNPVAVAAQVSGATLSLDYSSIEESVGSPENIALAVQTGTAPAPLPPPRHRRAESSSPSSPNYTHHPSAIGLKPAASMSGMRVETAAAAAATPPGGLVTPAPTSEGSSAAGRKSEGMDRPVTRGKSEDRVGRKSEDMIRGGRKSEDRGGRKSEDRGGRKSESSDRGSTSGGSLLQKGAMLFRKAGRSSGEIKDR